MIADNFDTISFSALMIQGHEGKKEDVKFNISGATAKNPGSYMLKGKMVNPSFAGSQDALYAKLKNFKFEAKEVDVIVLPPKFDDKGVYVPYMTVEEAMEALTVKTVYRVKETV
jgi:hypothetical protein